MKIKKLILNILTAFPKYLIIGVQCIISKEKRKQLNFEKKVIPTTITILSLITYLTSIFLVTRWYVQNERIKKFSKSISEQTIIISNKEKQIEPNNSNISQDITTNNQTNNTINHNLDLSYLNINFNNYIKTNSETVGWIKVNGTKINYPIVRHNDNDFYLKHDFYKNKSVTGWIFLDYRNELDNLSNNTIIYGHNLVNRSMFGSLIWTLNKNWYDNKNNNLIKISTPKYNSLWQVFSIYKEKPNTDYLQTNFNSIDNYQNFLNTLKNKSIKNFNVDLTYQDKIITLSTCDDTGTKRVVLHAKLYSIENK